MILVYATIVQKFSDFFQGLEVAIPPSYRAILSLLLYTVFIVIYSIFIWKFYRFMAKREIIDINLSQYNQADYPGLKKLFEIVFNTVEYAIILPFLVLFWFAIFSIFLLVLSKDPSTYQILLVSAAIISSTRITAYMSEDLSKDIAKIFPFTVLALFLLEPDFFKIDIVFDRIIQIPELLQNIFTFIFFIELFLRSLYSIAKLIYADEDSEEE